MRSGSSAYATIGARVGGEVAELPALAGSPLGTRVVAGLFAAAGAVDLEQDNEDDDEGDGAQEGDGLKHDAFSGCD